jgi:hypothetical protein
MPQLRENEGEIKALTFQQRFDNPRISFIFEVQSIDFDHTETYRRNSSDEAILCGKGKTSGCRIAVQGGGFL